MFGCELTCMTSLAMIAHRQAGKAFINGELAKHNLTGHNYKIISLHYERQTDMIELILFVEVSKAEARQRKE